MVPPSANSMPRVGTPDPRKTDAPAENRPGAPGRSVARFDPELLDQPLEHVPIGETQLLPRALLNALASLERRADVRLGEILRAHARALRFGASRREGRANCG